MQLKDAFDTQIACTFYGNQALEYKEKFAKGQVLEIEGARVQMGGQGQYQLVVGATTRFRTCKEDP
jgi:exonuclease VII large subunit